MSQIHPDQTGMKESGDQGGAATSSFVLHACHQHMANNALGSLTPFLFFSQSKKKIPPAALA